MKVLMIVPDGFEEIEAFCVIDILRRANVDVTVAGLTATSVEGIHKVRFFADKRVTDINPNEYDMLVLPGGPGHKTLANSQIVLNIIKDFNKKGKFLAAICAAPSVLAKAGVLDDKIATIYPGMEKEIPKPRDARVIAHGNVITSRSPGTAIEFALKLVEIATDKKTMKKIQSDLCV
ncbi:MAG: DJ-1 family glyoxalase III [Candidatus Aenigmatarchaeota archaeon]